ncbi:tRNA (mnm(5)s(2)U34)-methyltransferase / FAD-dependent cmnm(5)s(2)U34 oxidoreductase [Burkholderiales bacterium 8X]|nr:tRNA (mnm(5)s(2)U34)-methyltransferase / FAD-dependent cmnm(5)s(2)U34 oxidoreductase [Burkholderiales bacterium 8X]
MPASAEPVEWRADGTPRSARFDDIYHSESGALTQAKQVFLRGCALPEAWADRDRWRVLETGFGLGLDFLATWQAWRRDPRRPRMLHYVSIEAHPVARDDLLRAARTDPEVAELAELLAAQWHGLLNGFHRLAFEGGRVLLTLCIGDVQSMLRAQRFEADSIFLDGFSPARNPAMWSPETLRAVSRFAREGTRIATWTVARAVIDGLVQNGFSVRKTAGVPPKRDRLEGVFAPSWKARKRVDPLRDPVDRPGHCAVVGAGLAGAAVAASLARRGWRVTVIDAAGHAAAGASSLPAGLLAPHVSPDEALLSRLTRAGIRITWQALEELLQRGTDWQATGAIERRAADDWRLPVDWTHAGDGETMAESRLASDDDLEAAGLSPGTPALYHARAGWVRPSRLVQAWLDRPGIRMVTGQPVDGIVLAEAGWRLLAKDGRDLVVADRVVIAAGHESIRLAPSMPLQPVRGQLAWAPMTAQVAELPRVPVNGNGHLLAHVPAEATPVWVAGATFDRERSDSRIDPADTHAIRQRLTDLHPAAGRLLESFFESGQVRAWAGVRCASADRRPLVGPVDPTIPGSPWVCTAMGSRGLSFAALCAELLAARWHDEPLPLADRLANSLDTRRLRPGTQNAEWPPATRSPTPPSTDTTGR